jgi:molybdenum cofactor cytidylyltransferase
VEQALEGYPVEKTHNEDHAAGEMLSSLQKGLKEMPNQAQAALIGLGDQPQVQEETVGLICETFQESKSSLIVPSFQMKRGHPWLVARPLWREVLTLEPPATPRDFLNRHAGDIHYVDVETPSVLADLDTPEDYQRSHP